MYIQRLYIVDCVELETRVRERRMYRTCTCRSSAFNHQFSMDFLTGYLANEKVTNANCFQILTEEHELSVATYRRWTLLHRWLPKLKDKGNIQKKAKTINEEVNLCEHSIARIRILAFNMYPLNDTRYCQSWKRKNDKEFIHKFTHHNISVQ